MAGVLGSTREAGSAVQILGWHGRTGPGSPLRPLRLGYRGLPGSTDITPPIHLVDFSLIWFCMIESGLVWFGQALSDLVDFDLVWSIDRQTKNTNK